MFNIIITKVGVSFKWSGIIYFPIGLISTSAPNTCTARKGSVVTDWLIFGYEDFMMMSHIIRRVSSCHSFIFFRENLISPLYLQFLEFPLLFVFQVIRGTMIQISSRDIIIQCNFSGIWWLSRSGYKYEGSLVKF